MMRLFLIAGVLCFLGSPVFAGGVYEMQTTKAQGSGSMVITIYSQNGDLAFEEEDASNSMIFRDDPKPHILALDHQHHQ